MEIFEFNGIKYKFYGIIFMKSSNHYTSYCHINFMNELDLVKNNSYYYDDSIDDGKVSLIEGNNFKEKINSIINYNPFIILFIKDN